MLVLDFLLCLLPTPLPLLAPILAKRMVRVGHLCVAAAAASKVCTAFVAPVGSAAAGLARLQHARVSVSERSQSSALHRAEAARASGGQSRRRQLGLQVRAWRSHWSAPESSARGLVLI